MREILQDVFNRFVDFSEKKRGTVVIHYLDVLLSSTFFVTSSLRRATKYIGL
ncbi:hypothetical protein VT98_14411 [Candidatus Electrothrix communis]|uniref:Uncharacterized protein n=1 Tax=Candidatus Electrothrix communis TaxID=1859133 RepID=A0A3S3R3K4_9BACT|nr:hypothetical protein VT98_14411 [Candidatus Electrothrix communis]